MCKCAPFRTVTTAPGQCGLAADLAGCIDDALNIYTELCLRAYAVSIVRTRWTGGERGVGQEEFLCRHEILPVPRVVFSGLQKQLLEVGSNEQGQVTVSEISSRYSEDFLSLLQPGGGPVDEAQQAYYEVSYPGGQRRRFALRGVPVYDPEAVLWSVYLTRSGDDRSRLNGDPEG
jgi:hypothetical protein